ncbi:MAG TPA: hypothetical protein VN611_06845 [Patescibacteria group bacterium]|nr:hypothetical protein [Patescibacteria group bacterium]
MNMGVDNIIKSGVSPVAPRIQPGQPSVEGPVIQTPEAPAKSSVQINLEGFLRSQLSDLAKAMENRSQLMAALPEDVRSAVQNLIQQASMMQETLPQGMTEMLKSQRNLAEQLQTLGETLANAAVLNEGTDSEMRTFLAKVAQQFTDSSSQSPEAAAKDLLKMVTRLIANEGELSPNQAEAVKKLAEQLQGKSTTELSESEQKLLQSLVENFGGKVAEDLKQMAQLLQAKNSTAGLTPEQEKTLADLIKNLPPEIGQIAQEMMTASGTSQKLSQLAETLEFDTLINANSPKELQDLLAKTAEKFATWSTLPPGQAAEELQQLAQRLLNNDPAAAEIKQMLQQLAEQLPAMQPDQLSEKENTQLKSLLKNLEAFLPETVRQAAVAEDMPELPRLWTLFKAAGASQWKNIAPQEMEQAAALLSDLSVTVSETPATGSQLLRQAELLDSLSPELIKAVKDNLGFSQGTVRINDLVRALQQAVNSFPDGSTAAPASAGDGDAWVSQVVQKALQQLQISDDGSGQNMKAAVAALQELAEGMTAGTGAKSSLAQALSLQQLPTDVAGAIKNLLQQEDAATQLTKFSQFMTGMGANEAVTMKDFQQVLSQIATGTGISGMPGPISGSLLTMLQSYAREMVTTVEDLQQLTQKLSVNLLGGTVADLPENEQRLLQQLVKNLGANLPPALQQASARASSSQVTEIYTLLKAIGTGVWQEGVPDSLQKAADIVREMAQTVQKGTGLASQKQVDHSVLSFTTPLYFGEGGMPYPAYVHIYQQNNEAGQRGRGKSRFETWMRVSLETENLGVVDTIFRLYDDDQLSVRVRLNGLEAAEAFSDGAMDIRKKLNEGKLKLAELSINAV